jgi:hemerythrin
VYALLRNEFITDKYDKIASVLDELKNYTVFHFRAEEEYMMSIKYKKFLSHKVLHDDFISKVTSFDLNEIDQSQQKHLMEILEFVLNWIDGHILHTDKFIVSK